jgi:hypothetical protein
LAGLVHLPPWQKYNNKYFINEIPEGITEECNYGAGCQITKTIKIQMDNSRVCNALETAEKIRKKERLVHPPYSPDLSPCAFCFLDGPGERCEIRDLLIRMTYLAVSLLMSFGISSRATFGD